MTQGVRSVLFVCLGNICRSPLAEGVFLQVLDERGLRQAYAVDSAGTGGWHAGSAPDPRSVAVAFAYGIDISAQQARKVRLRDFDDYDLLLGMDRSNVDDLKQLAGPANQHKVHLFMEHTLGTRRDVPDPYYGGAEGFESVYRMIREASEALADKLEGRKSPISGHASSMT
jgi:protein-tyrosine phosphatase